MNKRSETNTLARGVVCDELKKRGFPVVPSGLNFLINEKRINVKGCNSDNKWVQKEKSGPVWDKLNPKKFDYFVCVAFYNRFNNARYFIFSSADVEQFPNVIWNNMPELRKIMINPTDKKLCQIIKSSENGWEKIR